MNMIHGAYNYVKHFINRMLNLMIDQLQFAYNLGASPVFEFLTKRRVELDTTTQSTLLRD